MGTHGLTSAKSTSNTIKRFQNKRNSGMIQDAQLLWFFASITSFLIPFGE